MNILENAAEYSDVFLWKRRQCFAIQIAYERAISTIKHVRRGISTRRRQKGSQGLPPRAKFNDTRPGGNQTGDQLGPLVPSSAEIRGGTPPVQIGPAAKTDELCSESGAQG
jgi:hypothetical protein